MVLLTTSLAAACGAHAPDTVRPTLDWLAQKGLPCLSTPTDAGTNLAQWTCRAETDTAVKSVLIDGDEDGVFSLVAQMRAVHDGVLEDGAALAFFEQFVVAAPPNASRQDAISDWLTANPEGGITTLSGVRLDYTPGRGAATLSFSYRT